MSGREFTPSERSAKVAGWLRDGYVLRIRDVARIFGVSWRAAYRTLQHVSRAVDGVTSDQSGWYVVFDDPETQDDSPCDGEAE
jgi:hypothetical protein